MRIRPAVPVFAFVLALAGAAWASAVSYEIRTTGTVLSKTSDALVVRIDDHGHHIRFDVDRSTILPDGLARGQHVQVTYHPTGSTGQAADSVSVVPRTDRMSTAWATPPSSAAKSASN
jgi:hypothetical protein